jgi:hypothetical protein
VPAFRVSVEASVLAAESKPEVEDNVVSHCVINRYAITGFVAASSGHPNDNTDMVISNNQVKWIQSCLSGSLILSSLL